MTDLTTDTSTSPSGVGDEVGKKKFTPGALIRSLRTGAPVAPFLFYVTLGLLIPTIAIINLAFRSNSGKLTWANITTILSQGKMTDGIMIGGQFRAGFENSIKLALVTADRSRHTRHLHCLRHRHVEV